MTRNRVSLNLSISLRCPLCGGYVGIDRAAMTLVHSMPPCDAFVKRDTIGFLQLLNATLGKARLS